jgi:hypothetical protein
MEPFVCFLNFVFLLNFSIFASQYSELTLWVDLGFSPSTGIKGKIFFYFFFKKEINEAPDSSKNTK